MRSLITMIVIFMFSQSWGQAVPTGSSDDFKVKTCLHSVSYAGVWRGHSFLSVDDFLVKAKELGYDGVMLVAKRPHVSPFDYDQQERQRLRQKIKDLGLELVGLAGYTDFTAGCDKPGIPNVEIQASYVGQVAKLAHDLGTNMVRIFTGYIRPDLPYDKQYAMVVEGLKLAGKKAAEWDVTLAVQNHHDIAIHHDEMYWLIQEVDMPNVKVGFDAWSPTLEGLTPLEISQGIRLLEPYLVNTIVAQYVKMPQYRYVHEKTNYKSEQGQIRAIPLSEPGIIDYDTFISTLQDIGYQGYLVYEMCEVLRGGGSMENLDKTAKAFLDYVKKFE
jgi:sugar phosphate isomerase/epimerase